MYPVMSEQVATYEGRAAVPLTSIFGGFRKLFFLQPRTFDLYGRVQVDLPCAATPLGATAQEISCMFWSRHATLSFCMAGKGAEALLIKSCFFVSDWSSMPWVVMSDCYLMCHIRVQCSMNKGLLHGALRDACARRCARGHWATCCTLCTTSAPLAPAQFQVSNWPLMGKSHHLQYHAMQKFPLHFHRSMHT